jgi:hypothetical protein
MWNFLFESTENQNDLLELLNDEAIEANEDEDFELDAKSLTGHLGLKDHHRVLFQ